VAPWRHGPWTAPARLQLRASEEDFARRAAFALSAKLAEEKLTVVDGWQLDSHKTSGLVNALDKLSFTKSALLVSHGENRNLELASRNIESVKTRGAECASAI